MNIPTDRKYTDSHEWFEVDGQVVTIGITQFAADELTDITFVDLPEVGSSVDAGHAFGEVESVKATAELMTALSGAIIEINGKLAEAPDLVNRDPYGDGWMIKMQPSDLAPLEGLMNAAAYERFCAAQEH